MRRVYETPVATEEMFVANSYIAACDWQITSTSGNNRIQCANPSHSHYMNGTYITSVWVEATNSTCRIKVDQSGIGRTEILYGNNAQSARNAVVYEVNGTRYYCTSRYNGYNVPDFVNWRGEDDPNNVCYGTYVNTGDYNEIMEKVMS